MSGFIRHPILERCGVAHGFGMRDCAPPEGTFFPRQVHGSTVHHVAANSKSQGSSVRVEADAVCATLAGTSVAIATADCVPILACTESTNGVVAIHAGWRGLANGVIEAGIEALRSATSPGETIVAAVGPHIGQCCYEVDAPVLDAISNRFGSAAVERATVTTRPGHARLALGAIALMALEIAGISNLSCALLECGCTSCEGAKFHSYRRDGKAAGRMAHFIATPYR